MSGKAFIKICSLLIHRLYNLFALLVNIPNALRINSDCAHIFYETICHPIIARRYKLVSIKTCKTPLAVRLYGIDICSVLEDNIIVSPLQPI